MIEGNHWEEEGNQDFFSSNELRGESDDDDEVISGKKRGSYCVVWYC